MATKTTTKTVVFELSEDEDDYFNITDNVRTFAHGNREEHDRYRKKRRGIIPLKDKSIDLENHTRNDDPNRDPDAPYTLWMPARERQTEYAKNALKKIKTGEEVTPEDNTNNIGALLVSSSITPDEKKNADVQHRKLRRRAARSGVNREDDGLRRELEDDETESDEMSSDSDSAGSPTPGARKRKRNALPVSEAPNAPPTGPGGRVLNPKALMTETDRTDPRPPTRRRPATTVSQLMPTVDVAKIQPRPLRLQYERPARGDRSDAWFIEAFRHLYREAEDFVSTYYCIHNLKVGTFYEPWAVEHTPEFIAWAEQVAEADPVTGWDNLLRDTKERKWLIMGVIMRVLKFKVFDEELFGVDEREHELMHSIDKTFFLSEGQYLPLILTKGDANWLGFHRTGLRAQATRAVIGNSSVTGDFYPQVAALTAQISLMLQPLTGYLYALPPPMGKTLPLVTELYQSLHNLVSRAAQLSLTVRLSPTIFHIVDTPPGSVYEPDDVYSLELESYNASKERIVSKYEAKRAAWQAKKDAAKKLMTERMAVGPAAREQAIHNQARIVQGVKKGGVDHIKTQQLRFQKHLRVRQNHVPQYDQVDVDAYKARLDTALVALWNAQESLAKASEDLEKALHNEQVAQTPRERNAAKHAQNLAHAAGANAQAAIQAAQPLVAQAQHNYDVVYSDGPANCALLVQAAKAAADEWNAKEPSSTNNEIQEAERLLAELEASAPGATQQKIDEAQAEFARLDNATPTPPGQNYRSLTKIAVWPTIMRYKPGSAADDTTSMPDGPLRQSEKDGMRIMQISRGAVVNYYGRTDSEKPKKVMLRKWVKGKREKYGPRKPGVLGIFAATTAVSAVFYGALVLGGWDASSVSDVVSGGLENVFQFVGSAVAAAA